MIYGKSKSTVVSPSEISHKPLKAIYEEHTPTVVYRDYNTAVARTTSNAFDLSTHYITYKIRFIP